MRILIFLAVLAGIICLQVFLSKRENQWCGLVLPIICFLFALLIVPLNTIAPAGGLDFSFVLTMVITFLVFNIATAVFMAIYYACRKPKGK